MHTRDWWFKSNNILLEAFCQPNSNLSRGDFFQPIKASAARFSHLTARVETGVEQGDIVSMHYDPIIAKLVVWGEDRSAALIKMKDSPVKFQVAGLPTNIDFLLKLANDGAFSSGDVTTHFIERYKDDLFSDLNESVLTKKARLEAHECASILAACLCVKEHAASKENITGHLSPWYSYPPFRVNINAQTVMELKWIHESSNISTKPVKCLICLLPDGKYLIDTGEINSSKLEIEVLHLSNLDFRVEVGGVSMNVSLAVYSKDQTDHIHFWRGLSNHQFRRKIGLENLTSDDKEAFHKSTFELTSHSPGTVLAPMAGLVVKVLVKFGETVEEGQSVLVLEAMKMEHVVKAPTAGYVSGLRIAPGQKVFDGNVLFSIKK